MNRPFKAFVGASVCMLSACSVGITKDGQHPHDSFSVQIGYQEAFRSAESSLRECHSSSNPLMRAIYVNGNLFTDKNVGAVRVTMDGWSNDMVRVDMSANQAGATDVTVVVWGGETWDQGEIDAIKQSIESGRTVCRTPRYQQQKASNAY